MSLTLEELKEKLSNYYDEISLLELLNINSDDLVERFSDRIYNNMESLSEEFEGEDQEYGDQTVSD